ncbi:hypothetical protein [Pseudoalteromonas rubra]|uniref:hypothetical protein n=1 Tax=Pseudoalteromonas rubra TaxID=43658 RepID=UPI000F793ECE|nr:hypothetical protein [Pseudoalteromonas rubra]
MMKGAFPGRATLTLLFALINLCVTHIVDASSQTEFEQAYAPIQVGKITTFIPIELRPDAIVKLSSQELDGYTNLAWTPSPQADYYQIFKFDGQTWQLVASRVTTSFYRYNGSGSFKVVACHRFGCSSSNPEDTNVSEALAINAFYAQDDNALTAGSAVIVGWQLSGATSAVVTHTQNGGSHTTRISSTSLGRQSFTVFGDSQFTLTAYGFNGQSTSTSIQVPIAEENPFLAIGTKSDYKQPLFGLNLDIIERTVFQNEHHLIFSTHDGKLYFFRAQKDQEQPVSWQQEWAIELEGVVNSAPRLTENHLYYNETNSDNQGRTCKVRLADIDSLTCTTYEDDALLTSPVIINNDGDYSAKFMDSLAGVNQKATGVYAFYHSGKVKIFDQQDLTPEPQSFTLAEHIEQPVINTPTLFLNKKNIQGLTELILVKDQDQVLGVAVPTASSVQQQSRSFGVLSVNALSEPKPMSVLWKGAL